jgi:alpha-tubulin suppressor-like RCC1 family protein
MAIKTDGGLWAWGLNGSETAHGRRGGWLGDGTVTDRPAPIKIMDNVLKVSAGAWHTLVIKADGTLWAWGRNTNAQLGDGSTNDSLAPVKVIGSHDLGAIWFMNGVTDVSAGAWHSMAIKTDGSLWGWGQNGNHQIIDGPGKRLMIPAKVMDDVVAAAIGSWHTIALKKDGSLWGWGNGPLGDGATGNHRALIKIMDGVKLPDIAVVRPSP